VKIWLSLQTIAIIYLYSNSSHLLNESNLNLNMNLKVRYFTLKIVLNLLMVTKIVASILFAVFSHKIGQYLSDELKIKSEIVRLNNCCTQYLIMNATEGNQEFNPQIFFIIISNNY
jgi:hypothetical protein